MSVTFTAHNIRLDDGTCTLPSIGLEMPDYPWFQSARRILDLALPGDANRYRLADLGCLEGGYAVEFARLGYEVLGIEVRDANIAACRHVQSRTALPNLAFAQDDAWNVAAHGRFDAIFCCGLFYHIDRPRRFLELLASTGARILILQTHFATHQPGCKFALTDLTEHEGLRGRWWTEFENEAAFADRANARWASWNNRQSFWLTRESILQGLSENGFDLVVEQFDSLAPDIAGSMASGYYHTDQRGTFVGIRTASG